MNPPDFIRGLLNALRWVVSNAHSAMSGLIVHIPAKDPRNPHVTRIEGTPWVAMASRVVYRRVRRAIRRGPGA
jgi:hypothetical protein